MERPSIEEIHEVMKEQGMKVFTAPYDCTLGWIRTNDNRSEKFNDWIFMSHPTEHGGINSIIIPGTSDAGLYYRLNPMHVDGTAIIQHGKQFRGVYEYQNPAENPELRGHMGKEGFRQVGPMDYWRDADRDEYLEFVNPQEGEIFYTNGHDMGTLGRNVGKWSAGCWGATNENMDLLYAMARVQIKHGLGTKFSLAALHESMF
jgi:hypothetical protein